MIYILRLLSLQRLLSRCLGITLAAMLAGVTPMLAQDTGSITGLVLDAESGAYLEGADVSVEGTSLRTSSVRGGRFSLAGVPTGSQTLVINYPGLATKTQTVDVRAGETIDAPVRMGSEADVVVLEAMNIRGAREGMSQAIALQRASIQTKLVAANDQFGQISEGNVGEYLKFLPGVGIDYTANDARGISLRGLNTSWTVVTVDGTPMASASSGEDTRRFEFEQIAMNNVETTELYKTVTPDISASATGGFVNFVTKSAFDREDISIFNYDIYFVTPGSNMHFSKKGGLWGKGEHFTIRPNLELNYGRRINDKIGFNINYRLSEKYDDAPRTEHAWFVAGESGSSWSNPRLSQLQLRDEQKLTHREALAAKIDYNISDDTRFTVSGQWNWYDLTFTQRGPVFNLGTNQTPSPSPNSAYSGVSGTGTPLSSVNNTFLQRNKYGTTLHANATLSHDFGNGSKAWASTYWSNAESKYRDTTKGYIAEYVANLDTNRATAATDNPRIRMDNIFGARIPGIELGINNNYPMDNVRSLSNYNFNTNGSNIRSRPFTAEDQKVGANAHYIYDLSGFVVPLKFQVGAAYDLVERDINRVALQGTDSTNITNVTDFLNPGYGDDVGYGFGSYQVMDPYKLYDAFGNRLLTVQENFQRNFEEKNVAGYFRVDAELLPDLLLVTGVRWEKREIDGRSQNLHTARSRPGSINLEYDNFYPSAMVKYTPSFAKQLVVRAGASRTVGHPDYADLLVSVLGPDATGTNGSISSPAADLEPYYSKNYDLSVDYYFENSGVVGVSAFRKEVSNYITNVTASAEDRAAIISALGVNPAEFSSGSVTIAKNGKGSSLQGVEVSYAQQFKFLPKPFDGLSTQVNFTAVDVDGDDLATETAQGRNAVTKSINFVLGYRLGNFNFTSSTNWRDDVQWDPVQSQTFGSGASANTVQWLRWQGDYTTTDWKAEYSFNQRFSVYFLVRNVFEQARHDYLRGYLPQDQATVLPYRYTTFGEPYFTLGFRGTF